MTIVELMRELDKNEVELLMVGEELVVRGRRQKLNPSLLTQLHENKQVIVELIRTRQEVASICSSVGFSRDGLPPLVDLTEEEIEGVVRNVSGGADNVQDLYPLTPLQEGFLFHYLATGEGDPYLQAVLMSFDTRARLEGYISAMQAVVDRHDILRTAVMWEGLREPVQVVLRKAVLPVEEVQLDPAGDAAEQLYARFDPRRYRIDVRQAPLLRLLVARDQEKGRWLMVQLMHHLAGDHVTTTVMQEEIEAHLLGREERLPAPLPFRNLVAQARFGMRQEEHEAFFRQMLGDVDEPTAPFGLLDVRGDGSGVEDGRVQLDGSLALRIRERARRLAVSAASLFHVAWAQVLARVSGREDVVFGTVLLGRMEGGHGSERVMGMLMNTLPVRIHAGPETVEAAIRRTHDLLAGLMHHEHASLALAQRCSAVLAPKPLFSAVLNYRHSARAVGPVPEERKKAWDGIAWLRGRGRTNYPFALSIDDLGEEGFMLSAEVDESIGPTRVCGFMRTALERLVEALETAPSTAVRALDILTTQERDRVLYEWNDTKAEFPSEACIHELFEEQAARSPHAVAVVFEDRELTYAELNRRANRLGHHLRELGVKPDVLVAVCVERGFEMIVSLLAVLKAGGAYVPLDPSYPEERLRYMLEDSAPAVLLTQRQLLKLFSGLAGVPIIDLTAVSPGWRDKPEVNPDRASNGLTSRRLAYVIYTSGSTGNPKGVMVEHRSVVNFLHFTARKFVVGNSDVFLAATTFAFDISALELYLPLSLGAKMRIVSREIAINGSLLLNELRRGITVLQGTPATWTILLAAGWEETSELKALCGGEALSVDLAKKLCARSSAVWNLYGPTETTIWSSVEALECVRDRVSIGRPIANTQIYILNGQGQAAPVGVAGELYIGGAGVARGYWNRPELTAERFLIDPFAGRDGGRMYRTGDLARWLPDGNIECLGRSDHQVKIRGFRIEPGEIEALLAKHPGVRETVVIAREDTPGDKRLVAYVAAEADAMLSTAGLREQIATLPAYMMPNAFVHLDALPRTPNGKLDRKLLPLPESDAPDIRQYEAPIGEVEITLARIWAGLLKVERVGRHDNFFDLGGHSLLVVTLIERMRRADLPVDIPTLFNASTLAALADSIKEVREVEL